MSEIDYDAFADEVRGFVEANCPADLRALVRRQGKMGRAEWARWQAILHDHGWGAPAWPAEHGGCGWNARQRFIFDEILCECDAPPQYHHGLRHLGPTLIEYGTQAQRDRFLPGILDGTEWWCQGYSEPGAGSDLASLRTRAVRDGDVYVVQGQKIWTSHAHEADLMYALVRTSSDGRKQQGITKLLIPLDLPGVTVKEIRTVDGMRHVNEVFLDDVRVPVENRVGEEGEGWACAKFLLSRERLGSANTAPLFQLLSNVRRLVDAETGPHMTPRRRDDVAARLLRIEADLTALRAQGRRAVDAVMRDESLGVSPSAIKLQSSNLTQRIGEVAYELVGQDRARRLCAEAGPEGDRAGWISTYFYQRARTIVGGSDEVQKNMIARELFGR